MADPNKILAICAEKYPEAWVQAASFRAARGRTLPDWPPYVYLPMAGAYAIVSGGSNAPLPPQAALDISMVAAATAWRMTRGVYRFDPTLFEHVVETPVEGKIPCEVLHLLPEWCIYIETPGHTLRTLGPLEGFWAHLEYVTDLHIEELRLVLDCENGLLIPVALHLTGGDLADALDASLAEANFQAQRHGHEIQEIDSEHRNQFESDLSPILSLILYLCAVNSEIRDARGSARAPRNPKPVTTNRGKRIFPASAPTTWEVGYRTGAALRAAEQQEQIQSAGGTHTRQRPHIRRAHWHSYWTGPRADQKIALRWLSPILVGTAEADKITTTIRKVLKQDGVL